MKLPFLNQRGDNRKPGITWGQRVGREECPYLRRWVLNLGRLGSIRLHHWYASDDDRALHDHPWWFATLVLKGGYADVSEPRDSVSREFGVCPWCLGSGDDDANPGLRCAPCRGGGRFRVVDHLLAPTIRFRSAHHTHTVQVDPGGCWTLMLTGPHERDWGFWVDGTWMRMRRYFRDHGHHPCD